MMIQGTRQRDLLVLNFLLMIGLCLVVNVSKLFRIEDTHSALSTETDIPAVMQEVLQKVHNEKLHESVENNFTTFEHPAKTKLLNTTSGRTCLDPKGPVPVIYVSRGRSGSASTWQLLGSLTGRETPGIEVIGSNNVQVKTFFQNKFGNDLKGNWALKYFCLLQKRYRKHGAKLVGFRWKPFTVGFTSPSGRATWERIEQMAQDFFAARRNTTAAKHDHLDLPIIRVIRTRRNPLDVYLSQLKHHMNKEQGLGAHCPVGYKDCLQKHEQVTRRGITIPDVSTLYKDLKKSMTSEDKTDDFLRSHNIPTVFVSYDKLYYPGETEPNGNGTTFVEDDSPAYEWNRIFDFLFEKKSFHVTWKNVKDAMHHASTTSSRWHNDLISNFDEVYAALNGTDLDGLLRYTRH